MKKTTNINVVHRLADGTIIEDISKVVIPNDHPIYDFLASILERRYNHKKQEKKEN